MTETDLPSFLNGFIAGFLVAGVTAFLLGKINEAVEAMRLPDKPMKVETKETPRAVVRRAAGAVWRLFSFIFWFVLWLLAVAAYFVYLFGGSIDWP